ncbi:hypothetical protein HYPSUDRAFT_200647 [Hypholoma sublateritium FD-334 SS-4]|uniref:Uncharacterized protein n=1 Tax=Hypholoma sublateritium (strain FD-334 SS-4) TaxID=945553 RepID=A0A0D2P0H1_HYPSF|nr:hypothetical protein HYPSUDRAFT_200647 [Hypholoma sublateritium FD-334 SS-4]
MGRKRIYHTPEAKLAANRAKSKRHYDKVKDIINAKRRKQYSKKVTKSKADLLIDLPSKVNNGAKETNSCPEPFDPLATWVEHAKRLARRLHTVTNGPPAIFVDHLCRQFIISNETEPLNTSIEHLGSVLKSVSQCHDKVLQLSGVGPELASVTAIMKDVRMIIGWIDEILCVYLVDKNGVSTMYSDKRFMFQGT